MSNGIAAVVNAAIAVLMKFGKVAWVEVNNYRKDYGDTNEIRNSLATREWSPDNPVPACPITEAEVKQVLAEREAQWKAFRDAPKTPKSIAQLTVFELLFTEENPDAPGERKLIVPELSGNAGFRRARSYFDAMVQRFEAMAETNNADLKISGLVPIRPTTYKTEVDRILDQQNENEMQGVGTKRMDDLEKLQVTYDLFHKGAREVDIRRLYVSSTGQKLFGIVQCDASYPELKIFQRFFYDPSNLDWIKWGPIRHNEIGKINQRTEAQRKRNEGLPLKPDERGLDPITQEEVDNYFRDKSKNDGEPVAKMMAKKEIEAGAKNHKLLAARTVFDSVALNTPSVKLRTLMEHAEPINMVTQAVYDGKGNDLKPVAVAFNSDSNLLKDVSDLINAGRGAEVRAFVDSLKGGSPAATTTPTPVAPEPAAPTAPAATSEPAPTTPVEPTPEPKPEQGNNQSRKQRVGR